MIELCVLIVSVVLVGGALWLFGNAVVVSFDALREEWRR